VPLIPGINDDSENLEAIGRVVAGLERTRRVHLLPHHPLGAEKQDRLGRGRGWQPPATPGENGQRAEIVARLAGHGLDVHWGG